MSHDTASLDDCKGILNNDTLSAAIVEDGKKAKAGEVLRRYSSYDIRNTVCWLVLTDYYVTFNLMMYNVKRFLQQCQSHSSACKNTFDDMTSQLLS